MKRAPMINRLRAWKAQPWDVLVIGGGATGLGAAVDSAARGYKTLLLEMVDFAKGTSSRSTKLVHGGVRYLAQGDISLVLEALHERGLLRKNAPHLVRNQAFVIPTYSWWRGPFYTIGMKVYDMMAGKLGLGPSKSISREETLAVIPNLSEEGLQGGVVYYDGQFDDARLAINLAQTCVQHGGTVINYMKVSRLLKNEEEMCTGVLAVDEESGEEFEITAKVVINATGVFADSILKMDDADAPKSIQPSQGVHLVLESEFLQSDSAIMIPRTDDGRVLFAVPWHGKVVVGTTDTQVEEPSLEPRALEEEVDFILKNANRYLAKDPTRADVLSVFAGLRPLAAPQGEGQSTKEISRSHKVMVSLSGLITVIGGKWTTYRKMAEDTINKAMLVAGLENRPCPTENLPIHGALETIDERDSLRLYGSDEVEIRALVEENPEWGKALHPRFPFIGAQVVWAVREEMARTVEDVLARRIRALFLDARASIEMAPQVAAIMATEMGRDSVWKENQLHIFTELAKGYLLDP